MKTLAAPDFYSISQPLKLEKHTLLRHSSLAEHRFKASICQLQGQQSKASITGEAPSITCTPQLTPWKHLEDSDRRSIKSLITQNKVQNI